MLRGLITASAIGFLAIALGLGQTIAALSSPKWAPDPDIGLSDAERQSAHAEMSKEFWAHYVTWLGELDHRGLREYPVEDLLATVGGPQATLADAVTSAELIVAGRVESVDFRFTGDGPDVLPVTAIRVTVDRVIKGTTGSTVEFVSICMLMPSPDWEPPSTASRRCRCSTPETRRSCFSAGVHLIRHSGSSHGPVSTG